MNGHSTPARVEASMIATVVFIFLFLVVGLVALLFFVLPLILAFTAKCNIISSSTTTTKLLLRNSALYTGNVWHTRFHPKIHSFTYPIFMFALDLEELEAFRKILWPLSMWLIQFREKDHLKNGEGMGVMVRDNNDNNKNNDNLDENMDNKLSSSLSNGIKSDNNDNDSVNNDDNDSPNGNNDDSGNSANDDDDDDDKGSPIGSTVFKEEAESSMSSIGDRIMRLVAKKTNNKFKPTLHTHSVMILTHLCYYGYNFNPVSFYYIIDKKNLKSNSNNKSTTTNNDIAAIVGEVSNTPWLQQYCYVLHPESVKVIVKESIIKPQSNHLHNRGDNKHIIKKFEYSFPKEFHVSPFMEMDYFYDWSFIGIPGAPPADVNATRTNSITVVNTLRKRKNNRIEFTAKLVMESNHITPFRVVWQMIKFPMYCMIIQIWIHYQAVLLFLKGVVYIPHPLGSETTISLVIARIMIPFFALRDYYNVNTDNNKTKSTKTS